MGFLLPTQCFKSGWLCTLVMSLIVSGLNRKSVSDVSFMEPEG